MASLLSVNVGLPKDVGWQGHTVHTGIWKQPVDGPRMVRRLNIDGDGQGDLNGHGGEQRAVLVYQIESYRHWQRAPRPGRLRVTASSARTSPSTGSPTTRSASATATASARPSSRSPSRGSPASGSACGSASREMPALLVAHHRPGFYLRVIAEGQVQAGDEIVRTRVGRHALSVADVDALLYLPDRDIERLRAAVDIPALSPGWQQSFRELLDGAENGTGVAAPAIGVEPGWAGFRRLRVAELVPETSTVTSVYLTADDGTAAAGPRRAVHHPARRPAPAIRHRCAATRSRRAPAPTPTGSASSANRTASSART